MRSVELDQLILKRRAAFRRFIVHVDGCPRCDEYAERWCYRPRHLQSRAAQKYWEQVYVGPAPPHPCGEHERLLDERLLLNTAVTDRARSLGYTSASAYERAVYGRVGKLR